MTEIIDSNELLSFNIYYENDEKLKSCPFCGSEAWLRIEEYLDGDIYTSACCTEPNCCGWFCNYETREEAIGKWNKRV